jgi:hypothetical protein
MSSGCFDYCINTGQAVQKIEVQNAQVEIDAGYEFFNGFCIVEAKNIAVEEILIRQLYYPYRLWTRKISKPVIPLLMVYSNDTFYFFQYNFTEIFNYNSLELVSYKSYTFANEICNIMRSSNLSINQTTIERRSSTVRSWLDWVLRIANNDDYSE